MEGDGRLDRLDRGLAQRAVHARDGRLAGVGMHDEFADHRVVVRGDSITVYAVRVHAHARTARGVEAADRAGRGREVAVRVLGVDAALDRVAGDLDVFLLEPERLARRDADLRLDEIDARDEFRHRVLDLEAGVHLKHVEVLTLVHQELDGRGARVVGLLDQTRGRLAQVLTPARVDVRPGRLFDEFLVAPLGRAVALVEVHGVAVLVAQHLHLDVARGFEELLDVDGAVAEGRLGLGGRGLHARAERGLVVDDAHASPAAAGRGLHDDRVADLVGEFDGLVDVVDRALGAGEDRDLGLFGRGAARDLVAQFRHRLGGGADELDLAVAAHGREVRVLGEEAVARVDRVDIGDLGRADDARDVEVRLVRGALADADGAVGEFQVRRVGVGLAVDADGLDAEFAAGAEHAQRDLAAVGDQDARKQW